MIVKWEVNKPEGEIDVEDADIDEAYEAGGMSAVNGLIQYRVDEEVRCNVVAVPDALTEWKGKT